MTQENFLICETAHRALAHIGLEIIDRSYDISITDESVGHIRSVVEAIENNPNLSLIMYANHIANSDGAFIMWLYRQHITPNIASNGQRKLIVPASISHLDKAVDPMGARVLPIAASLFDIDLAPVVQTYYVGNGYSEVEAMHTYRALMKKIRSARPCDVIIFPEGHRTETGGLQQAESGITRITRAMRPVVLLPIGIIPQEGTMRTSIPARLGFGGEFNRGVNLGGAFRLEVGGGSLIQSGGFADLDALMMDLAQLLPANMRGEYPIQEP